MSAFDSAIATLFADQNLAIIATFVPQIGPNASLRVIIRAPDTFQKVGSSMIETPSQTLEVQVSDCPSIAPGDQFVIGSSIYTVQGQPLRDELQLTWLVDIYAS